MTQKCPFCGGEDLEIGRGTKDSEGWPTYICCVTCGAQGPWVYINDAADTTSTNLIAEKTGWNKQYLLAEVERLKEQIFFKCASPVGLCPYVEDTQVEVRPNTVGEFTGCKDRFDDEIYEGDILQQNVNSQAMPVIWENGKYIVRGTHDGDLGFYAGSCSVIGNIYANPELLTK